jgi:Fe2+ or Zn2+ uptake regulation protein
MFEPDKNKIENTNLYKLENEHDKRFIYKVLVHMMNEDDRNSEYVSIKRGYNNNIYVNIGRRLFLTPLQIWLLFNIPEHAYTPASQIAKNVGKSYDGIKAVYLTLHLLENKGLVELTKSGKRGGLYVTLTEDGEKAKQKLIKMAEEELKEKGEELINEIENKLKKEEALLKERYELGHGSNDEEEEEDEEEEDEDYEDYEPIDEEEDYENESYDESEEESED